jgi:hypothetical protein
VIPGVYIAIRPHHNILPDDGAIRYDAINTKSGVVSKTNAETITEPRTPFNIHITSTILKNILANGSPYCLPKPTKTTVSPPGQVDGEIVVKKLKKPFPQE